MEKHAIIVGAGSSGLSAAVELLKKGIRVTIVEALQRPGGRIFTRTISGSEIPVEAGAEFVHGDLPTTGKLVERSGHKLIRTKGVAYNMRKGSIVSTGFEDQAWEKVISRLKTLQRDEPVAHFLQRHFHGDEDLINSITEFVQGFDAADPEAFSSFALREELSSFEEEEQFRIEGGYGSLIDLMVRQVETSGGRIRYGHVIRAIDARQTATVVSHDNELQEADAVIVTVPLGILQRRQIEFTSGLPFDPKLFDQIGYGGVIKFFVELKEEFRHRVIDARFPDMQFIFSDAPVPTWWSQNPSGIPLLTGWLGGPKAFEWSGREDLGQLGLKSLASMTAMSIAKFRECVRHLHIEDWVAHPGFLGAYSYPMVGSAEARKIITEAEGPVFFAGEAFHAGDSQATVEAALLSGELVARKVAAWL